MIQSKKSKFSAFVAVFTAFCVAFTQVAFAAPAFSTSNPEVSLPDSIHLDQAIALSVPSSIATIDKLQPGSGKTIFHIQTAHGQYQADKQIESLLHYLEKNYGVETLLMEGASNPLNPEIINFFPEDRKSTLEAVDAFVRHSVISGPEVFLLNSGKARGFGIEEEKAYDQNLQDFADVIKARDASSQFLSNLDMGIERLAAVHLSSDLRSFLKQVERKETNNVPFDAYLQQLKIAAKKHAQVELSDASWQLLWPMLVRVFTIEKLEKKIDAASFEKQKKEFLTAIKPYTATKGTDPNAGSGSGSVPNSIFSEVEKLLNLKDLSAKLPDPETSALFENLVRALPDNFNYDRFSSVTAFCGILMLKSQLNVETLADEITRLEDKIADKLAETKNAKALIAVLKDYRMLKKLFALELLPNDYEEIIRRKAYNVQSTAGIQPSTIVTRLQNLSAGGGLSSLAGTDPNGLSAAKAHRSKQVEFKNTSELDALYTKAVRFYEGARLRDQKMLERIEERLSETKADRVAVVTGGFHSGPFAEYFEVRGYNYALMTPKLTTIDIQGRQNYLDVMQMWAAMPIDQRSAVSGQRSDSSVEGAVPSEARGSIRQAQDGPTPMISSTLFPEALTEQPPAVAVTVIRSYGIQLWAKNMFQRWLNKGRQITAQLGDAVKPLSATASQPALAVRRSETRALKADDAQQVVQDLVGMSEDERVVLIVDINKPEQFEAAKQIALNLLQSGKKNVFVFNGLSFWAPQVSMSTSTPIRAPDASQDVLNKIYKKLKDAGFQFPPEAKEKDGGIAYFDGTWIMPGNGINDDDSKKYQDIVQAVLQSVATENQHKEAVDDFNGEKFSVLGDDKKIKVTLNGQEHSLYRNTHIADAVVRLPSGQKVIVNFYDPTHPKMEGYASVVPEGATYLGPGPKSELFLRAILDGVDKEGSTTNKVHVVSVGNPQGRFLNQLLAGRENVYTANIDDEPLVQVLKNPDTFKVVLHKQEKADAAQIAVKMVTPLKAKDDADKERFLDGKNGYGVPDEAAVDGSHTFEGSQGYYTPEGKKLFLKGVQAFKDFFTRRSQINGKPIRLIIKPGIGGQHTPFQGVADMFATIVDPETGMITGEYELGKDYEASIQAILDANGWGWDQVAVIPSSKSGSTDETMMIFSQVLHAMLKNVAETKNVDGEKFAKLVFDVLHEVNFIDGNERPSADLFKLDAGRLGHDNLLDLIVARANAQGFEITRDTVKTIFAAALGNMFFETTDRPSASRISAFIRNSGLGEELGLNDQFGAMFDNVGGRWTGDLHMMTLLAFHDLDASSETYGRLGDAYWESRRAEIEKVRNGEGLGNQLGHEILDNEITDIALVIPDEAFWMGKAIEQNWNESIWQKGFAHVVAIKQSEWEAQKHIYAGQTRKLVINLSDLELDREMKDREMNESALTSNGAFKLPRVEDKQARAEQLGQFFSIFYGATNTAGTRLIARAIRDAGFDPATLDLNDLDNDATKIFQQNLFLLQPYVELGKKLLEKKLTDLQTGGPEAVQAEMDRLKATAAKPVLVSRLNRDGETWVEQDSSISNAQDLANGLAQADQFANTTGRKLVPFIYLEGQGYVNVNQSIKPSLFEMGYNWIIQGTGDQHISYQQVLAQPENYLPVIISFVPEKELPGLPAVGFAKGYLHNVSPHMARALFAEASYDALTKDRVKQGGRGLFIHLQDTPAHHQMVAEAFKIAAAQSTVSRTGLVVAEGATNVLTDAAVAGLVGVVAAKVKEALGEEEGEVQTTGPPAVVTSIGSAVTPLAANPWISLSSKVGTMPLLASEPEGLPENTDRVTVTLPGGRRATLLLPPEITAETKDLVKKQSDGTEVITGKTVTLKRDGRTLSLSFDVLSYQPQAGSETSPAVLEIGGKPYVLSGDTQSWTTDSEVFINLTGMGADEEHVELLDLKAVRKFLGVKGRSINALMRQDPETQAVLDEIFQLEMQYYESRRLLINSNGKLKGENLENPAKVHQLILDAEEMRMEIVLKLNRIGKAALDRYNQAAEIFELDATGQPVLKKNQDRKAYAKNHRLALIAFNKVKALRPLTGTAYREIVRGLPYAPSEDTMPDFLEDYLDSLSVREGVTPEMIAKAARIQSMMDSLVDDKGNDDKLDWEAAYKKYVSETLSDSDLGTVVFENILYDLKLTPEKIFSGDSQNGRTFNELYQAILALRTALLKTGDDAPSSAFKARAAVWLGDFFAYALHNGQAASKIDQEGGLPVWREVHKLITTGKTMGEWQKAEEIAFAIFSTDATYPGHLQGHSLTGMEHLKSVYRKMGAYYYEKSVEEGLQIELENRRPRFSAMMKKLASKKTYSEMLDFYKNGDETTGKKGFPKFLKQFRKIGAELNLRVPVRVELSAGSIGDFAGISSVQRLLYMILNAAGLLTGSDKAVHTNINISAQVRKLEEGGSPLITRSGDMVWTIDSKSADDVTGKSQASLVLDTLQSYGLFPKKFLKKAQEAGKSEEVLKEIMADVLGPGMGLTIDLNVENIAANSGLAVSNLIAMGIALTLMQMMEPFEEDQERAKVETVEEHRTQLVLKADDLDQSASPDEEGYYEIEVTNSENSKTYEYTAAREAGQGRGVLVDLPIGLIGGDGEYTIKSRFVKKKELLRGEEETQAQFLERVDVALARPFMEHGKFDVSGEKITSHGNFEGVINTKKVEILKDTRMVQQAILVSQLTQLSLGAFAGTQDDVAVIGGLNVMWPGEPLKPGVFPGSIVPDINPVNAPEWARELLNLALALMRVGMADLAETTLEQVYGSHQLNLSVEAAYAWHQITMLETLSVMIGDTDNLGRLIEASVPLRELLAPASINPAVIGAKEELSQRWGGQGFYFGISGARSTGSIVIIMPAILDKETRLRFEADAKDTLTRHIGFEGKGISVDAQPTFYQSRLTNDGATYWAPKDENEAVMVRGIRAAGRLRQEVELAIRREKNATYTPAEVLELEEKHRVESFEDSPLMALDEDGQPVVKNAVLEQRLSQALEQRAEDLDKKVSELSRDEKEEVAEALVRKHYAPFNSEGINRPLRKFVRGLIDQYVEEVQSLSEKSEAQRRLLERRNRIDETDIPEGVSDAMAAYDRQPKNGHLLNRGIDAEDGATFEQSLDQEIEEVNSEIKALKKELERKSELGKDVIQEKELKIQELEFLLLMLTAGINAESLPYDHYLFSHSTAYQTHFGEQMKAYGEAMAEGAVLFMSPAGGSGTRMGNAVKQTYRWHFGKNPEQTYLKRLVQAWGNSRKDFQGLDAQKKLADDVIFLVSGFTRDAIETQFQNLDRDDFVLLGQMFRNAVWLDEAGLDDHLAMNNSGTAAQRTERMRWYKQMAEEAKRAMDALREGGVQAARAPFDRPGLNPLNPRNASGTAGIIEGFLEPHARYNRAFLESRGLTINEEKWNRLPEEEKENGISLAKLFLVVEWGKYPPMVFMPQSSSRAAFSPLMIGEAALKLRREKEARNEETLVHSYYANVAAGGDAGGILVRERLIRDFDTVDQVAASFVGNDPEKIKAWKEKHKDTDPAAALTLLTRSSLKHDARVDQTLRFDATPLLTETQANQIRARMDQGEFQGLAGVEFLEALLWDGVSTALEGSRLMFADGIITQDDHTAMNIGTLIVTGKTMYQMLNALDAADPDNKAGYTVLSEEEFLALSKDDLDQRLDYLMKKWPYIVTVKERTEQLGGEKRKWLVNQWETVFAIVLEDFQKHLGKNSVRHMGVTAREGFMDDKDAIQQGDNSKKVKARNGGETTYLPPKIFKAPDVSVKGWLWWAKNYAERGLRSQFNSSVAKATEAIDLVEQGVLNQHSEQQLNRDDRKLYRALEVSEKRKWLLGKAPSEATSKLLGELDTLREQVQSAEGELASTLVDGQAQASELSFEKIQTGMLEISQSPLFNLFIKEGTSASQADKDLREKTLNQLKELILQLEKMTAGQDSLSREQIFLQTELLALFNRAMYFHAKYDLGAVPPGFHLTPHNLLGVVDKDNTIAAPSENLTQTQAAELFNRLYRGETILILTGSSSMESVINVMQQILIYVKGREDISGFEKVVALNRLKMMADDAFSVVAFDTSDENNIKVAQLAYNKVFRNGEWVDVKTLERKPVEGQREDLTPRTESWNVSIRELLLELFNTKVAQEAMGWDQAKIVEMRNSFKTFVDKLELTNADIPTFEEIEEGNVGDDIWIRDLYKHRGKHGVEVMGEYKTWHMPVNWALSKMLHHLRESAGDDSGDLTDANNWKRHLAEFEAMMENIEHVKEQMEAEPEKRLPFEGTDLVLVALEAMSYKESNYGFGSLSADELDKMSHRDDRIRSLSEVVITLAFWNAIVDGLKRSLPALADLKSIPEFAEFAIRAGGGYLNIVFGGISKITFLDGILQTEKTEGLTPVIAGDSPTDQGNFPFVSQAKVSTSVYDAVQAVQIPAYLAKRISIKFKGDQADLNYEGDMSEADRDILLSLSMEDQWGTAIRSLFVSAQNAHKLRLTLRALFGFPTEFNWRQIQDRMRDGLIRFDYLNTIPKNEGKDANGFEIERFGPATFYHFLNAVVSVAEQDLILDGSDMNELRDLVVRRMIEWWNAEGIDGVSMLPPLTMKKVAEGSVLEARRELKENIRQTKKTQLPNRRYEETLALVAMAQAQLKAADSKLVQFISNPVDTQLKTDGMAAAGRFLELLAQIKVAVNGGGFGSEENAARMTAIVTELEAARLLRNLPVSLKPASVPAPTAPAQALPVEGMSVSDIGPNVTQALNVQFPQPNQDEVLEAIWDNYVPQEGQEKPIFDLAEAKNEMVELLASNDPVQRQGFAKLIVKTMLGQENWQEYAPSQNADVIIATFQKWWSDVPPTAEVVEQTVGATTAVLVAGEPPSGVPTVPVAVTPITSASSTVVPESEYSVNGLELGRAYLSAINLEMVDPKERRGYVDDQPEGRIVPKDITDFKIDRKFNADKTKVEDVILTYTYISSEKYEQGVDGKMALKRSLSTVDLVFSPAQFGVLVSYVAIRSEMRKEVLDAAQYVRENVKPNDLENYITRLQGREHSQSAVKLHLDQVERHILTTYNLSGPLGLPGSPLGTTDGLFLRNVGRALQATRPTYLFQGSPQANLLSLISAIPADPGVTYKAFELPFDPNSPQEPPRFLADVELLAGPNSLAQWSGKRLFVVVRTENNESKVVAILPEPATGSQTPVVVFSGDKRLSAAIIAFPGSPTRVVDFQATIPFNVSSTGFQFQLPRLPDRFEFQYTQTVERLIDSKYTASTYFKADPGSENRALLEQWLVQVSDLAAPGAVTSLLPNQSVIATVVSDGMGNVLAVLIGETPKPGKAASYDRVILPKFLTGTQEDILQEAYLEFLTSLWSSKVPNPLLTQLGTTPQEISRLRGLYPEPPPASKHTKLTGELSVKANMTDILAGKLTIERRSELRTIQIQAGELVSGADFSVNLLTALQKQQQQIDELDLLSAEQVRLTFYTNKGSSFFVLVSKDTIAGNLINASKAFTARLREITDSESAKQIRSLNKIPDGFSEIPKWLNRVEIGVSRSESRELTEEDLKVLQKVITQFTEGHLTPEQARIALQIEGVDGARIREAVLVATGIGLITEEASEAKTRLDMLIEELGGKAEIGRGKALTERLNGVKLTNTDAKGYVAVTSEGALTEAEESPDSFWDKLMNAEEGLVILRKSNETVDSIVDRLVEKLRKNNSLVSAELKRQARTLVETQIKFKDQAELDDFIKQNQNAVALLDTGHDSDLIAGITGGFRFILKDGQKQLGGKNFWASSVISASLVQAMRMVKGLDPADDLDGKIIKMFNELKLSISKEGDSFKFGLLSDLLQQIVVAKYVEIMA